MNILKTINLALRGIMEAGIVIAFGYWGFHTGGSMTTRILLAIVTPIIGFGFWGLVDFHQLGRFAEPVRLIQELVLSGLAANGLYISGAHLMAWLLILISIIHHGLVYLLGERLIKQNVG